MAYDDTTPHNKANNRVRHRVNGLRDFAIPGEVKVYKANPDGSNGELIRIEKPQIFERDFKFRKGIEL